MDEKVENKESLEQPEVSSETSEKDLKECRIQWLHNDVQALVNLVGENWPDFQNGVRKKKYIWRDIATKLSHDKFIVNGEECDRKWRNLKIRYLAVREKQMNGEKTACRVDYFKRIHEFLKDDPVTDAYLSQRYMNKLNVKHHDDIDEEDFSEITSDGTMVWTEKSVELLLNLLLEFKDWFADKDCDRDDSTIWEVISEQMKLEGHRPGPEQCHRKWNNLALGFQHHKSEAEATGTLPLWPYYTRVRHIINSVNVPFSDSDGQNTLKRKGNRGAFIGKKRKMPYFKQEADSVDDDLMEQPIDTEVDEPISISGIEKRPVLPDARRTASLPAELRTPLPGEIREVCRRLDKLEENIGICRRLDRLEAKLDDAGQHREAQHQTNVLLGQVLSELSRLSRNLATRYQQGSSRESTDLSSGITIVVPNSNI